MNEDDEDSAVTRDAMDADAVDADASTDFSVPLGADTLAKLADEYWDTYQARLRVDKEAAALKSKESKLSAGLVAQMRMQGMTAVGGKTVRLAINAEPEYVPFVADWAAFYAHILDTKDFSFLEKRIGKAAVKERWAADVQVPGTDKLPVFKLSKSKVKG